MQKRFACLCIISLLLTVPVSADSLWENARAPFYGTPRRTLGVGDAITIRVSESTSAIQEAQTRTGKDSRINAELVSNWDQVANLLGNETVRKNYDLELGGGDVYAGTGQTSRRSRVTAVLTAIVTEILENGNVYVVGEHKVKVNNEIETIRVSGIVRPSDIRADNSVFSYQIAKAEVSVQGSGVVASKQTPGMMTKMFNWLF